jgi:glycosyltransferase involved in cell wall biosynthesis
MRERLCITLFGPLPSLSNVGGPETITYNLAKVLSELSHEVYVFKGFFGSGMYGKNIRTFDLVRPSVIKKSDIVHILSCLKSCGCIGAFLAKGLGKPLVAHFHQLPDRHFKDIKCVKYVILNTIESTVMRKMLEASDVVISVSRYSKRVLLNTYGVGSKVIPPGVDEIFFKHEMNSWYLRHFLKKYRLRDDDIKILFVGQLIPRKGVEYLIRAFKKVKESVKDSSLVIVGDGVDKRRLMSLANMLNLRDVYFLGRIPKNDLVYAYLSSNIFVLPTLEEGLGIALLEAMACGLPVVASKTSGVLDAVIDGETGILVPPRNVKALADAIIRLLSCEELRKKLSETAKEYAKASFNWRSIAQRIVDLYLSLL